MDEDGSEQNINVSVRNTGTFKYFEIIVDTKNYSLQGEKSYVLSASLKDYPRVKTVEQPIDLNVYLTSE